MTYSLARQSIVYEDLLKPDVKHLMHFMRPDGNSPVWDGSIYGGTK